MYKESFWLRNDWANGANIRRWTSRLFEKIGENEAAGRIRVAGDQRNTFVS